MAYGQGSLYKRGKVWWASWWDGGLQVKKSTGTADRREALEFLSRQTSLVMRGGRVRRLSEAFGQLFKDYAQRNIRSYYDTEKRLHAHVLPFWGKIDIHKVTPGKVDEYIQRRRIQGAANATINRELAIVRRALKLAYQAGHISFAPHVKALPETNARTGFLEPENYERLRDAMPEHIRCLFVIGYHLGCRIGELLTLKWEQVDAAGGWIRLAGIQTKTGKPRALPIYGEIPKALERQRLWCQENSPSSPYIFTWRGKRMNDIRISWRKACAAAGVEGLLFHDLRRTAVRNMERHGISRSVAMSITGHLTESVYRRYAIVSERDLQDAAKRLDKKTGTKQGQEP